MKRSPRRLPAALITFSLLAACAAPPTPPTGVIWQDDFTNVNSGWERHTSLEMTTDYEAGHYLIAIEPRQRDVWGLAGLDLNDTRLDAQAQIAAGPPTSAFGVLCRYTRSGRGSSFDFFLITGDGRYAVGQVLNDRWTYLTPGGDFAPLAGLPSAADAAHTLTATCAGPALSFKVDGRSAGQFQDSQLTHGDLGLLAETQAAGGLRVHFNQVTIRQP